MDAKSGQSIGRFLVQEEIGRGATGVVYRAYDPILNRQVALKLLAPGVAPDGRQQERFLAEGHALVRLKHPQLALLYEFGQLPEGPFLAMEWIDGQTVRQLLAQKGALEPARVVKLVSQLAAGLDYAHHQGVLHCDLKPANLIVNEKDQLTIVDFGLTWLTGLATAGAGATREGACFGTLLYASPEQLQGRSLTPASDLYSVACVVFEMLTGSPPYTGSSPAALLSQHLQAPIPVICEHHPGFPASLDGVFRQALAKLPEARPRSLTRFADELAGAFSKGPRPPRPRAPLLVLVLVLGLIGLIGSASAHWRQPAPTSPTPTAKATLDPDASWAQPGGNSAHSGWVGTLQAPAQVPRWEVKLRSPAWSVLAAAGTVVCSFDDGHLEALDGGSGSLLWQKSLEGGLDGPPTLAPWNDPPAILTATAGKVLALRLADGHPLWHQQVGENEPFAGGFTLGDDGEAYAVTRSGTLVQLHVYSGEIGWSLPFSDVGECHLAPLVDGAGVYLASEKGWVVAVDRSTHKEAWRLQLQGEPTVLALAGQLFVGSDKGVVTVLSLLGRRRLWSSRLEGPVTGIAVAGGHLLANSENQLAAWDVSSGEQQWLLTPEGGVVGGPLCDGNLVAISNYSGVFRLIDSGNGQIRTQVSLPLGSLRMAPLPLEDWWLMLSETTLALSAPLKSP